MSLRNLLLPGLMVVVLASAVPSLGAGMTTSRTFEKSLAFSGEGPGRLIVDNIWGGIEIRGYGGDTVELTVTETVRAKDSRATELARQEVELAIRQSAGEIELYVDGPFRCRNPKHGGMCWESWHNRYEVVYDLEIRVPHSTHLEVRTVTEGNIQVTDVRGDFEVHNVNGSIKLLGLAGAGRAETVNGGLRATFVSNPATATRFKTVNGTIDVSFQPRLSADLELVARWGEAWSEFDVEPLPAPPPTKETRDGRTVIKLKHGGRVRVGAGGPMHSFETLNGDIYVRSGT